MDGEYNDSERTDKTSEKDEVTYRRKCICGGSPNFATNLSYVLIVLNVLFIVLFVVLFLRLENVKTELSRMENEIYVSIGDIRRTRPSTSELASNDGSSEESMRRKNSSLTDSVWKKSNSTIPPTTTSVLLKSLPGSNVWRRSTEYTNPTKPAKSSKKKFKKWVKDKFNRLRTEHCTCQPGPPGPKGPRGRRGKRGLTGPRGPPGSNGFAGLPGQRGLDGQQGPTGLKGKTGPPGPKGDKGDEGNQGPPGKRGPPGEKGEMGVKGVKGENGPKGEKGDRGGPEPLPRPSAHITGYSQSVVKPPKAGILRHWDDTTAHAHSFGGMRFRNGELVIPKIGRYYIYSQLYFQAEDDKPHLIHYIHLTSNNITSVIMRSVTSRCPSKKTKTHLFSSYQGGVFALNTGDSLSVGVSEGHSDAVSMEESTSFFGGFMI